VAGTLWAIRGTGVAEDDSPAPAGPTKASDVAADGEAEEDLFRKRMDAHRLIVASGAKKRIEETMRHMLAMMRKQNPGITDEFIDEFLQQVDINGLIEQLLPVYTKHLTHDEIKGLIRFYKSPLGKAMLEKMPAVQKECMDIGARWGAEAGQKATKAILQRRQVEREE
jgi:hypothetical protein